MAIAHTQTEFKTFFYGEFGFLNWSVLGMLDQLTKTHPDYIFFVATFPDYLILMQKINPNVRELDVNFKVARNTTQRDKKRSRQDFDLSKEKKFLNQGIVNLIDVLSILTSPTSSYVGTPIKPLTTKLSTNFVIPEGKYISVFCRQRKHEKFRNLSPQTCNSIIKEILGMPEYKDHIIIFHGLPSESKYLNNLFPNSRNCSNIEEAIAYLAKSDFLLSAVFSGYGQFASNCGTNVINVGSIWKSAGPWLYNPFNAMLEFGETVKETLNIIQKLKPSLKNEKIENIELQIENKEIMRILSQKNNGYFIYIGNKKEILESYKNTLKNKSGWNYLHIEPESKTKSQDKKGRLLEILKANNLPQNIDYICVDCGKMALVVFIELYSLIHYIEYVSIKHDYIEPNRSYIKSFLEKRNLTLIYSFDTVDFYVKSLSPALATGYFQKLRKKIDMYIGRVGSLLKEYYPALYIKLKEWI